MESPLSCSAPSAVPNVDVDEAAGVAFGSEASEPDGFFVHCRAFFWKYRARRHSRQRDRVHIKARTVDTLPQMVSLNQCEEQMCIISTFSVKRLILPGSLKKMLFFTLSPLTWEWSMVTRQARGAVPLSARERYLHKSTFEC